MSSLEVAALLVIVLLSLVWTELKKLGSTARGEVKRREEQAEQTRESERGQCWSCASYWPPELPVPPEPPSGHRVTRDLELFVVNNFFQFDPRYHDWYGTCRRFPPPGLSPHRQQDAAGVYEHYVKPGIEVADNEAVTGEYLAELEASQVVEAQRPPRGRFPFVSEDDFCGEYSQADAQTCELRQEKSPLEWWKERWADRLRELDAFKEESGE